VNWNSLAGRIDGRVVTPDHPDYDHARGGWNLMYSHHPATVVEAASAGDVVETVRAAAQAGAGVTVQATGHGFTTPAEEVLVVTTGIDHVEIDPAAATARVGAGVKWEPVLGQAQRHGLAPLLGSSPGVGAVGYTLGGGFGWLGRRHGLCADRVRWFRVVLADGSLVTASAEENPDLFWALRGGGHGSLGVVVEMEIELVAVDRVYGGNLLYPIEAAMEVFDRYREWSADLPDEITSAFTIMNYPPIEDVPEPVRGRSFALVRGCHCGDMEEAAAMIDGWRRWREPAVDMFGPMPFGEVAAISQDPIDPVPAMSSGRWLSGLDLGVGEAIVEAAAATDGPSPVIIAETRHAGGAISRPPSDTAYSTRHAERLLQIVALTPTPEMVEDTHSRLERLWHRLDDRVVAPYLNFLEGDERREAGGSAFDPATWERLTAIKAKVDPDGIFSSGLAVAG
jgi:FAD/FMN-containing dehydrogenase